MASISNIFTASELADPPVSAVTVAEALDVALPVEVAALVGRGRGPLHGVDPGHGRGVVGDAAERHCAGATGVAAMADVGGGGGEAGDPERLGGPIADGA